MTTRSRGESPAATAAVSLTTDYGLADGFVAACHGVIARIAPAARVIDVTHLVPPGDVRRGAAVLAQTVPHLPTGVHVAVVDPGVGTARRGVALATPEGFLVGPDNGLLLDAAAALGGVTAAVELTNPGWLAPQVSATFHGRDVFAPVAARLALGAPLAEAGPALDPSTLVRLPDPVVEPEPDGFTAEVLTVDHFGNVQLAAPADLLAPLPARVRVRPAVRQRSGDAATGDRPGEQQAGDRPGERQAGDRPGKRKAGDRPGKRKAGDRPGEQQAGDRPGERQAGDGAWEREAVHGRTFGDAPVGGLVAHADSAGRVALSVNGGRAADLLAAAPGTLLRIVGSPRP